jgi:hypothetical protein
MLLPFLLLGCLFNVAVCAGKRVLPPAAEVAADELEGIEVSPEDLAIAQEVLPGATAGPDDPAMPHVERISAAGRIDLVKLWDMLTAGMNSDEKKAYAKEFVIVVQRYQERETVQEHKDILMLIFKTAVALAAVGVVAYVIYAVVAASKQETERVKYRSEAEKAASKAGASHTVFEREVAAAKAQMAAATAEMHAQMRRDADRTVHDFNVRKDEIAGAMRTAFTETQGMLAGIREQARQEQVKQDQWRQAQEAQQQKKALNKAFAKWGIAGMY